MLRDFSERLVRLAFPLRSAAVDSLVDTDEERQALRKLQSVTASTDERIRAYVGRPFQYPCASRFSDGRYGVLYAANSLATALCETAYHLARIYADVNAPAMETRRVEFSMHFNGRVEDIRHDIDSTVSTTLYDRVNYASAQKFGATARDRADAVHYDSVRNLHGGRCVGAFTPSIVGAIRVVGESGLVWDGARFIEEHRIRSL